MNSLLKILQSIFGKKKQEKHQELTEGASLRAIVVTDLGNVRKNNEDAGYFIRPNDLKVRDTKGFLGIVADGMGGHAAGEVASQLAIETIRTEYYSQSGEILDDLETAFQSANTNIFKQSQTSTHKKGMGTTATAVVIRQNELYYAHVGDSRLYLLGKTGIKQLSIDHTYVQELLNKGEIDKEKAAIHPERNVLTRALGTKPTVQIEKRFIKTLFQKGDRLLLCSDGLYDYFNDNELHQKGFAGDLKSAAYDLINTAKSRGGHDNITVVIIESITQSENSNEKVTTDLDDLIQKQEKATEEVKIQSKGS